ncbi:MAG: CRP-like cAMP-binding protein [Myxococcota bacterium]|jgi:CRP-like cAMP-binding protein
MALFGYGMRMATVEALTNADLLLLDRDGYAALRDSGNPVAKAVEQLALSTLMARLTSTSDRIADLADGSPAGSVAPPKSFFQRVASLFGGGGRRETSSLNHREILGQAPFFHKSAEGALDSLAKSMVGVEFSPGEFVCREGDSGDEMFIVAEGLLEVFINTGDDRVEPLASLEPGDAFGMLALFHNRPRMASCVARTNVACLALSKDRWSGVVGAHSPAGSALRGALIRCLSDQLAFANARLSQLDLTQRKKADQRGSLLVVSAGMDTYGPAGRNGAK